MYVLCVNVSIVHVHICTHKHTLFVTFNVDISLKSSTNINIDCKLILNHSNLQLDMSILFTMLPNMTFILTDGSTIIIRNDMRHFGPDQDAAPRLLYHRDYVEGDLTGSTAWVEGTEGVVVGE